MSAPEFAVGLGEIFRRLQVLSELLLISPPPLAQVQSFSQDSVPGYGGWSNTLLEAIGREVDKQIQVRLIAGIGADQYDL